MGPLIVAVGATGLSPQMAATVARLAGTGERQEAVVTVVHVARVWGTGLGIQHPALQPGRQERAAAREVAARAARDLRAAGIQADALVVAGRDVANAVAATARRSGARTIVVGRGAGGRLSRLLRGPDLARALLAGTACTLVVVESERPGIS